VAYTRFSADWQTGDIVTEAAMDHIEAGIKDAHDLLEPETWKVVGAVGQPAFQNSWENHDPYVSIGGPPVSFTRVGPRVYLRGLARLGTVGATIFTLPTGYRPSARRMWPTVSRTDATTYVLARVDVIEDGTVVATVGGNNMFSLDVISFTLG
jgi:hypothetical protein